MLRLQLAAMLPHYFVDGLFDGAHPVFNRECCAVSLFAISSAGHSNIFRDKGIGFGSQCGSLVLTP